MSRRRPSQARPAADPVALPVAPKAARRLIFGGMALLLLAAAMVWAMAQRLPERALLAMVTAGSAAGFSVRQVEISGAIHQPRLSIYRELLTGGSDSMLLVDLQEARRRLEALPWVKEASLQRRWPDRLEVRLVERQPAALFQHQGEMHLIDQEGVVLPDIDLADFAALPLLVGEGAERQAPALLHLLEAQPKLAGRMRAAVWVGGRRWDLRMEDGETISLPEGSAATEALARFAAIDRETPLLGRGFIRFDLRIPDKMVVRTGDEPGAKARPRPQAGVAPAPMPGRAA